MSAYVSPTAPIIGPAGITAPDFAALQTYLINGYEAIYGADSYLGNDSQDGQFIALIAQALADCNAACIAVFNGYGPNGSQGAALSSNVKINGLTRLIPSYSTIPLTCVGVAGTPINNGVAQDTGNNTLWNLPSLVTIPASGTITVTATAQLIGATVASGSGTVTKIATPVYGWQSVTNGSNLATPGNVVETDAALRLRQGNSVALPSQTIFEGVVAALRQLTGVTRCTGYENNTSTTQSVTGGSLAANSGTFFVEGGTQASIINTIFTKFTPGIATPGSITQVVTDTVGSTRTIGYSTPTDATITAVIAITPLTGWNANTEAYIVAAVVAYINAAPIGSTLSFIGVLIAASLGGNTNPAVQALAPTFAVASTSTLKKNSGAAASSDVTINYNEAPLTAPGNVSVSVI